jgi:class 3 adenylate cyclase
VSDNGTTIHSQARSSPGELSEDAILTTHKILGAFGRDARSIEILHADLFDSRPRIAISALQALGRIRDPRSFGYISRLFRHSDPEIACSAVRASGEIGAPDALQVLLKLSANRREEVVQLEILRTLAGLSPDSPEVNQLAATLCGSRTVQREIRAASLEVLLRLRLREGTDAALALAAQVEDAVPSILQIAVRDERLAHATLAAYQANNTQLSLPLRATLVVLAAPLSTSGARNLFFKFLADENPSIRRECYRRIGTISSQIPHFDVLGAALAENAEVDPSLEAEALQAVDAMVAMFHSVATPPAMPLVAALTATIAALFEELRDSREIDIDTSHETGLQIANAREYMEFYFDEEMKKTFLQSIKTGGSSAERRRCARTLKESAMRLEMRHFEGYRILHELLADPTRSGIALFIRHLSLARTEKRQVFGRLKRCLSLVRLARPTESKELFADLLRWAREMKLYRLAEHALFALHSVDPPSALAACRECMTPPVTSRMLAIAAVELVKDTDLATMEPVLISLLHENDRYIRLALLDALSAGGTPGDSLMRSILQLLSLETDMEVASKLAELLGAKAEVGIAYALINVYERFDEWKKSLALSAIHRIAQRSAPVSGSLLPEFLYRVLRSGSPAAIARVPATLLALGDDYAPRVLSEVLSRLASADRITLVRDLRDDLRPSVITAIWSLLREEDPQLQETLRSVLPATSDPRAQKLLVSMVRTLRIPAGDIEAADVEPVDKQEVRFSTEKDTYRFEREHVRVCAVLFSDIQDYSSKAQELSPLEITSLLQEYEGILLPIVGAHEGALIKRMGDGHFFLFSEPLCAVLAAIRVQKALRRFNRFRPEKMRVPVRIGIHWGEVVEKGGDALGNSVNIAFRLQSIARGGSTCISQELFGKVAEWIHANDLGSVSIKGMRDLMRAWEPTEIALGLPRDLDPLTRSRPPEVAVPSSAPAKVTIDRSALNGMFDSFAREYQRLREVCRRSAHSIKEAESIEEEFDRSWRILEPTFSLLGKRAGEEPNIRPMKSESSPGS